ncbi:MAG: response regulator [Methyloprofundus sp.]|nr:response regulator [Methyloprofundus sp.]
MNKNSLRKILYVEDDPDIKRIAQIALEKVGGFEIKACNSGAEALAVVSEFMPDLILLDVMLPEMDGLEIQVILQQSTQTRSIPVVFMTAKVQKNDVEDYHRCGALGVIAKPFNPITLAGQLRELWNKVQI